MFGVNTLMTRVYITMTLNINATRSLYDFMQARWWQWTTISNRDRRIPRIIQEVKLCWIDKRPRKTHTHTQTFTTCNSIRMAGSKLSKGFKNRCKINTIQREYIEETFSAYCTHWCCDKKNCYISIKHTLSELTLVMVRSEGAHHNIMNVYTWQIFEIYSTFWPVLLWIV